jgi:DNA-binding response OmpR family regulator
MRKILIVSSDERMLASLKHELCYRNYFVLTESDPQHTFDQIRSNAPDLLIVDLILRNNNGGALSHQVKSDPDTGGLPVIILSDSELETRHPSKFACDLVLRKSPDIQPLLRAIARIFESSEFLQE